MRNYKTFKEFISESPVGDFRLNDKLLDSLEMISIPNKVVGSFYCYGNRLTSLQYGPTIVTDDYSCTRNKLISLKFGPKEVGGSFWCSDNELTSLEFAPVKVGGSFHCKYNSKLTSLEGITTKINGSLSISNCTGITSLQGIHKIFKGGYIRGSLDATGTEITSHLLGLLLIPEFDGIKEIANTSAEFKQAANIINKHLDGDRDVIECQQELIEAGLKAYAQL